MRKAKAFYDPERPQENYGLRRPKPRPQHPSPPFIALWSFRRSPAKAARPKQKGASQLAKDRNILQPQPKRVQEVQSEVRATNKGHCVLPLASMRNRPVVHYNYPHATRHGPTSTNQGRRKKRGREKKTNEPYRICMSYHMDYGIVTLPLALTSHEPRELASLICHNHHSQILVASQTKTKRHQWRRTE